MKTPEIEDPDNWHYRGEGAANVVLTYRGQDSALVGKVLRLRKSESGPGSIGNAGDSSLVLSAPEQKLWADYPEMASATTLAALNHVYAKDVLRPLLGDRHVDPGILVRVSSSFVASVNYQIGNKRPAWRAKGGSSEALSGVGLLISDHTYFPLPTGSVAASASTISVELKPKCGFLPTSPMIRIENSIKKVASRFTMHQHLKFRQGKIKRISNYDPLDLFSGTKPGIVKAVLALFETPQNNLRVFLNGDEVFGESERSSTDGKLSFARLEDALDGFVEPTAGVGRVRAFQELVAGLLFEGDVLGKLLAVQKLDRLDIEGAIQAYGEFLRADENLASKNSRKEKIQIPVTGSGVGGGQDLGKADREEARLPTDEKEGTQLTTNRSITSSSFEDHQKVLRDFLISTTAKDCGLMLTLQPLNGRIEEPVHADTLVSFSDRTYFQKTLLLDLDVKRLNQMNHYLTLDEEVIHFYRSIVS